jgi:hypothetical protein
LDFIEVELIELLEADIGFVLFRLMLNFGLEVEVFDLIELLELITDIEFVLFRLMLNFGLY